MKRNERQMEEDREKIKKLILEKFSEERFTTGDIYYNLHDKAKFNWSLFGCVRVDLIALTKARFLKFTMGKRSSKFSTNKEIRRGAIYSLNQLMGGKHDE